MVGRGPPTPTCSTRPGTARSASRRPGPTYLVCTHGGHDACCALRGRPLARALPAPARRTCGSAATSAATGSPPTSLVLPHGFYYGQVPGDGADLVAAHDAGAGGAALAARPGRRPVPAQAAQHVARGELGLLGVDDLPVRRGAPADPAGRRRSSGGR